MPVLSKAKHTKLMSELRTRFYSLTFCMQPRPLNSPREGAGAGRWSEPDAMVATVSTQVELRLALADFKSILAELGELK